MKLLKELVMGFAYHVEAIRFVNQKKLWRLFWLPAFFSLGAFFLVGYMAFNFTGQLLDYLSGLLLGSRESEGWWVGIIVFFLSLMVRLLVMTLYINFYRYIVLIFFTPMLAFVSDKVQEEATGIKRPFNMLQYLKDVWRGSLLALVNMLLYFTLLALIVVVTFLLPILAPISTPLIFILDSYFYGFSMIDYRNEYAGMTIWQSRYTISRHRGLATGVGAAFLLALMVPILGVLFAPVLSLIAAGLAINVVDSQNLTNTYKS